MDAESPAQREERLKELWHTLDTKRSGRLDITDLKVGLAKMNHPLKDADGLIRDMLTACDIDHDGQITYDEFVKFCNQTEKELWAVFQTIDRDRSGNLDKAELSQAFERAGVTVSNARLDRFFGYIDKNHDGKIDFAEWRDFLLFIPTNTPGMKQIFSYYTAAVKLTAEGDVHLTHEALSGLGTTFQFLRYSLFGAIIQIYDPPPRTSSSIRYPTHVTRPPEPDTALYDTDHPFHLIYEDDDPHIPTKPARRKAAPAPDSALEEENSEELQRLKLTDLVPNLGYFAAGGLSGIVSRTSTAPLDRLKVYLIAQTGSASQAIQGVKHGAAIEATKASASTLWNASKELWAAGGLRSLFAGNGLNVLKVMPESAVKFGSYEASKRAVAKFEGHNNPKQIRHTSQFIAGGLAGMVAQAVVYPLDTLKFRTQCETVQGAPKGNQLVLDTARKMWRTSGVVGYYRGLPMGLIGMFPYSAIDLFAFENLKQMVVKRNMRLRNTKHEEDALPNNFSLALIGAFSGAMSASVVYPINLLRTRLQSQGTTQHPRMYTGVMDVTRQTIQGEGVRGLFKGLTPNLLKVVPSVSITYVVYENTKTALHLS
ncbi:uncharacterized protein LTR77_008992 [Saxophila tyrrhenica]|uniref:Mitochondrial thiamine pyrophosphate carrier 1 n=1 Tax=Saxophila tyrrhenica TaxID=1690608 RepID=A0AAV9NZ88_9PEZI|nr:hypothetical protein LTR77_008992 [Saxophila tyrrhenica]